MEITRGELNQLTNSYAPSRTLPSANSRFATDLSIPLLPTILGPDSYRQRLTTYADSLLDRLIDSKGWIEKAVNSRRTLHLNALTHLLHSLAHVTANPSSLKVVGISLNSNDFTANEQYGHLARDPFKRVVSLLSGNDGRIIENGRKQSAYCGVIKGTYDRSGDKPTGVRTRLEPLKALQDELCWAGLVWAGHPYKSSTPFNPAAPVPFLDDQPLGRELADEELVIPLLNERLASLEVSLAPGSVAEFHRTWDFKTGKSNVNWSRNQLVRKFKHDEQSGGRLFGHAVQHIRRDLRFYLTFDGEATCEYDYKSMQPNLSYSLLGLDCPLADPYDIPPYGKPGRELMKECFVVGVGCEEGDNMVAVLSNNIQKRTGKWPEQGKAKRMFGDFWTKHVAIAELCGTAAWRKLQYLESQISLRVIRLLLDQDVTCIPIFDSFVVAKKHEETLKTAMRDAVRGLSSPPGIERKH